MKNRKIQDKPAEVLLVGGLVVRVADGLSDSPATPHPEPNHGQKAVDVVGAHRKGVVLHKNHCVLQKGEIGDRRENVDDDDPQQTSHQKLPEIQSHRPDHVFEHRGPVDDVEQHEREEQLRGVDAEHREGDIHAEIEQVGVDQDVPDVVSKSSRTF